MKTEYNDENPSLIASSQPLRTELLPFKLRIARQDEELEKVARLRSLAYGRHLPAFGERLRLVEAADKEPGNLVLLTEAKFDDEPLGSLRVHTNINKPLPVERAVTLPARLGSATLAEAVRLNTVSAGEGRMARDALFKAFYLACVALKIDWMVICARSPLDKIYRWLCFENVLPNADFVPMPHIGDIPHRVLALKVSEVESKWREVNHPLYNYFFHTHHVDLDAVVELQPIEVVKATLEIEDSFNNND